MRGEYLTTLEELHGAWIRPLPQMYGRVSQLHTRNEVLKKNPKKEYRIESMQKFFHIEIYNRLFFKGLFAQTIFGNTDIASAIRVLDQDFLMNRREALLHDTESLFSLSTPAVNFLTLSNYFFGDTLCPLSFTSFSEIGDSVVLRDKSHDLDARIYFYTHAIIGATHFYARRVPEHLLPPCREMVRRVEELIRDNYELLSLDHKCEFLVCAILCGYTTSLKEQIYNELTHSISPYGTFFINAQNAYAEKRKTQTISSMEHTNILALIAFLPKNSL